MCIEGSGGFLWAYARLTSREPSLEDLWLDESRHLTNRGRALCASLNGWQVYDFAKDAQAGDATGQGVGGVWWVIGKDGNKISAY